MFSTVYSVENWERRKDQQTTGVKSRMDDHDGTGTEDHIYVNLEEEVFFVVVIFVFDFFTSKDTELDYTSE